MDDPEGAARASSLPSRRDRIWTFVTSGLVAVASLAAWYAILSTDRAQGLQTARSFAEGMAGEIEWRLREQSRAAQRLARFWLRFGRQQYDEWRYDSQLYLENNSLDQILWLDPEFQDAVWEIHTGDPLIPARAADQQALEQAQRASSRDRQVRTVGPLLLEHGDHAMWNIVPVGESGRAVLAAATRLGPMLQQIAHAHEEQCGLTVRSSQTLLYSSSRPACRSPLSSSVPIHVQGRGPWLLTLRPAPETLGDSAALPHMALAGGLLTALLLGGVMWTRGVARTRAGQLQVLNAELESRVRARTAALDDAVQELQAFNQSISHDLRSPLGAVLNFAVILDEDQGELLDEEGRQNLSRIRQSATAVLGMLDSLLELSQVGRRDLRRRPSSVPSMAEDIWHEFTSHDPGLAARLELGEIPPVHADPSLLRLILANLLSNALKFSSGRQPALVQVAGQRDGAGVLFWVRDNGVGFDMAKADRLFRIFGRLHSASAHAGSGVGLAVTERIVRRHGGRIWAESEPEQGATFFVFLPDREPQ